MQILAHVKWFVENEGYPKFTLNFAESLFIAIAIVSGLVALYILNKVNWFNFTDKYSSNLKDFLPLIVRLMAAATIFLNLNSAVFLAPNFDNSTLISKILTPILIVIASMFVLGFYTKYAAFGFLASYLVTFFAYNPFDVLDHLELVGISLFLIITGSGLISYDNKIGKVKKPSNLVLKKASKQLLMWSGGAIAVLAVTEKLLGIELASNFLAVHDWNFLSGLGVSDYYFILIAGTFELLVGLSLILGFATRLTTLGVLVLMIITASLLGVKEIYGHLFAVAVVACSWVYIPNITVHEDESIHEDSDYYALQVVDHEADKYHAVMQLRDILKVGKENTLGIGDSSNDLPLLEAAGVKVAMGNAIPSLKAIADHVVGPVEQDGFAEAMERFVLTDN